MPRASGCPCCPASPPPPRCMAALALGCRHRQALPGRAARRAGHGRRAGRPVPRRAVRPDRRDRGRPSCAAYLALPAVLAVGGSWMVAPALLASGRLGTISTRRWPRRRSRPPRQPHDGGLALRPRRGVPLRPGLARRGDAAPRPGRGADPHRPQFRVWEGGGEYNVARGLRRCFGLRTAVVTALADNEVGRLVEDLILQGGVDTALIRWVPYDGVGRPAATASTSPSAASACAARSGVSDRGHTAAATAPGRRRLGPPLRRARRALAAHRRHLRRPVDDPRADVAEEAMTRGPPARHRRVLRPQLPAEPVAGDRRSPTRARRSTARSRRCRRDDRQRGGLHRLPRLRGPGADHEPRRAGRRPASGR